MALQGTPQLQRVLLGRQIRSRLHRQLRQQNEYIGCIEYSALGPTRPTPKERLASRSDASLQQNEFRLARVPMFGLEEGTPRPCRKLGSPRGGSLRETRGPRLEPS